MRTERVELGGERDRTPTPTWAAGGAAAEKLGVPTGSFDWRTVDRALRKIALRRSALDAEEARWLREAETCQVWRPLGMVSALDYMERVLGYAPRTAQDRLRVARALGTLPRLTESLARGDLAFSAIRELTRVATPATEAAWRDAAIGKNLRQVEELVADHRPGDHPDDPPDPQARIHVVRLELSAGTYALLRQARGVVDEEHGRHLSDDELVAVLCRAVIDVAPTSETTGRARFQVAVTVCERCRQGWQDAAGARIAISAAAVERAMCDAQHVGSIDGAAPERAYQDIPPSVARFVWRRDRGRCRAPGCRSARGLEIHHLVHRADGGSHDVQNLALLCSACHMAHHEGRLTFSGTAESMEARRANAPRPSAERGAHVGVAAGTATEVATEPVRAGEQRAGGGSRAPECAATIPARLDAAILRTQAKEALVRLGWKSAIAQRAVADAMAALGADATIERLISEALRRCPRPTG
jgi:HNH endonuclease/Holliday junction resolvase RuvA-like protein